MAFKPLDPLKNQGPGIQPLTGQELRDEVAFYKATADEQGEPYDPEWDRWLAEDEAGRPGLDPTDRKR